ncbi:DF family (seleno)protein [Hydrogenobaculum acidophilum]
MSIEKIEFLFFQGCPNSTPTYNNLVEALKELNLNIPINSIDVKDLEIAQKVRFMGSPSIYVNGVDIYTGKSPDQISYSCRTFNINGNITGVLPKEFIKEKLKSFL